MATRTFAAHLEALEDRLAPAGLMSLLPTPQEPGLGLANAIHTVLNEIHAEHRVEVIAAHNPPGLAAKADLQLTVDLPVVPAVTVDSDARVVVRGNQGLALGLVEVVVIIPPTKVEVGAEVSAHRAKVEIGGEVSVPPVRINVGVKVTPPTRTDPGPGEQPPTDGGTVITPITPSAGTTSTTTNSALTILPLAATSIQTAASVSGSSLDPTLVAAAAPATLSAPNSLLFSLPFAVASSTNPDDPQAEEEDQAAEPVAAQILASSAAATFIEGGSGENFSDQAAPSVNSGAIVAAGGAQKPAGEGQVAAAAPETGFRPGSSVDESEITSDSGGLMAMFTEGQLPGWLVFLLAVNSLGTVRLALPPRRRDGLLADETPPYDSPNF